MSDLTKILADRYKIQMEQCPKSHKINPYLVIYSGQQKYEISRNDHFTVTSSEVYWIASELSKWLNLPIIDNKSQTSFDSDNSKSNNIADNN